MKYWHYTVHQKYQKIIATDEIRPATKNIDYNEKPVVWFSTNPDWEETVRKPIRDSLTGKETESLSKDNLFIRGFPPVRIEANPDLVKLRSWRHFRKHSGVSKASIKVMLKLAKLWRANPKEWYITYKPVPLLHCLEPVEIWMGEKWVDIKMAMFKNKKGDRIPVKNNINNPTMSDTSKNVRGDLKMH